MLRHLDGEQVCTHLSRGALPRHRWLFTRMARLQLHTRRRLQHAISPSDWHLVLVLLGRDERLRVLPHLRTSLDASTGHLPGRRIATRRILPRIHGDDARERIVVHRVCHHCLGRVYPKQSTRERVLPGAGYRSGICRRPSFSTTRLMVGIGDRTVVDHLSYRPWYLVRDRQAWEHRDGQSTLHTVRRRSAPNYPATDPPRYDDEWFGDYARHDRRERQGGSGWLQLVHPRNQGRSLITIASVSVSFHSSKYTPHIIHRRWRTKT